MQAFERRHPAVNLIFFIAAAVLTALCLHPVFLAVSLTASLCLAAETNGRRALRLFFTALLPAAVFVIAINFLTAHYGVTVIATLKNGNALTLESLCYGSALAVAIVSLLLWFMSFGKIMTEDKLLHLTGRILPGLTFFITSVLRFVPMYSGMLRETSDSRTALYAGGKLKAFSKLKITLSAVSGVVTRALESSIDTADSMKARGYGIRRRKSYSRYRLSPSDIPLIAAFTLLFAGVIIFRSRGAATATYNPVITVSQFDTNTAIMLVLYTLLMFLPLIYDFTQVIKWHRLYSRI